VDRGCGVIDDTTATGDGCAVSARIKHWRQRPSDLLLSVKHPCHFRSRPSPITAQTGNRLGYSSYRHQVIPRTTLRGCACGRCTSSSRIASSVAIRSQPCRSDDGPDPKTDLDSRPGTRSTSCNRISSCGTRHDEADTVTIITYHIHLAIALIVHIAMQIYLVSCRV